MTTPPLYPEPRPGETFVATYRPLPPPHAPDLRERLTAALAGELRHYDLDARLAENFSAAVDQAVDAALAAIGEQWWELEELRALVNSPDHARHVLYVEARGFLGDPMKGVTIPAAPPPYGDPNE